MEKSDGPDKFYSQMRNIYKKIKLSIDFAAVQHYIICIG